MAHTLNNTVATLDTLPMCAYCTQEGNPFITATIDCKTTTGPWAFVCTWHYTQHGIGLGLGLGQLLVLAEHS